MLMGLATEYRGAQPKYHYLCVGTELFLLLPSTNLYHPIWLENQY